VTSTTALPDRVRTACAWVAERASAVEIDREALARSAAGMADDANEMAFGFEAGAAAAEERERMAALITCQGAINFGSGWWPTIRKRDGRSGFSTIAAALAETFCESPWSARELTSLDAREVADVLGQDADHPLMELYARTLHDVGYHVVREHSGRFLDLLGAADGSAIALAGLLARWDAFADASIYQGREIPFFKRAQILAADVCRAGLTQLDD
jgi:hypothetical protein